MPRKSRDVKRALTSKGFREEKRHHYYYYYFFIYNGQKVSAVYTKISHGDSEITDSLIALAKQVRLNNAEFCRFIDCSLSANDYVRKLQQSGHL